MEFRLRPVTEEEEQAPVGLSEEPSRVRLKPIGQVEEPNRSVKLRPAQEPLTFGTQYTPIPAPEPVVNQDPLAKYEGTLTHEQILADNDLFMQYVYEPMRVRFGKTNRNTWLLDQRMKEGLSREEILEQFINYQRSFAGGQTLTTASEVTFMQSANEADKATVGKGYVLFDRMPNIFSDDTSWGEMFDGMTDYARAAVIDPTTVLGIGVGRLVGATGTKAAGQAIRMAGMAAAKNALKNGATREVARQAMRQTTRKAMLYTGAANTATLMAIDLPAAIGADIGYQYSLMEGGAQEEYSLGQTGVAALGTVVLPAVVAGFKGVKWVAEQPFMENTPFAAYTEASRAIRGQRDFRLVTEELDKRLDKQKIKDRVGELISRIAADPKATIKLDDDLSGLNVADKKAVQQKIERLRASLGKRAESIADSVVGKPAIPDQTAPVASPTPAPASPAATPVANPKMREGLLQNIGDWKADVEAGEAVAENLGGMSLTRYDIAAMDYILNGDAQTPGLKQIIMESGFINVPRSPDDIPSNLIGDLIKLLPEDTFSALTESFGGPTGQMTPEQLGNFFKYRASMAGTVLNQSRLNPQGSFRRPKTMGDLVADRDGYRNPAQNKERLLYLQNSWKRAVTAHWATAAANVKGWSVSTAMNSFSDFVEGALIRGGPFTQSGRAKMMAGIRKPFDVANWIDTVEKANDFFNVRPDVEEKLSRFINGGVDGGVDHKELLKIYGLDENSPFNLRNEKVIKFLQDVSGTTLQDTITKRLSFMAELDAGIREKYGYGYNTFMKRKDAFVELYSPGMEDVIFTATNRAMRETFSKSYTDEAVGKGFARWVATEVERLSNTPGIGILIPFGQFLNNSLNFISDYTPLSFAYHAAKRGYGKIGGSVSVDLREENFPQLMARMAVGMSLVAYYFAPKELEKMEKGLRWNEEETSDGVIYDTTLDAPYPYFAILGRIRAHIERDGEVPADLRQEAFDLIIGQSTREAVAAGQSITETIKSAIEFSLEDFGGALLAGVGSFGSQMFSGFTRPLDPINQFSIMVSDTYEGIDRRQGVKAWNEAVRYIDALPGVRDLPAAVGEPVAEERRMYPTVEPPKQDLGRVFSGMREANTSDVNRMLAAVGKSPWNSVRWDGQYPQLKNRLDSLVQPILDRKAAEVLSRTNFFEKSLRQQTRIVEKMMSEAKAEAKEMLAVGSNRDPMLNRLATIYNNPNGQRGISDAMKILGLDDMKLEDIANLPDGLKKLELIIDVIENQKDYEALR